MIKRLHIAQCGKCGLFPAGRQWPMDAIHEDFITLADLHNTEHDAVAYAVKRGWCAYPLMCPTCSDRYKEAMRRGEVLRDHAPAEDDGAVRTTGEGAERADGGR